MASATILRRRRLLSGSNPAWTLARGFRSDAALEALQKAREDEVPNLVLYNYPSFSGAFSALFAHLFHTRLNLPCLILPFSSVDPFRVEDIPVEKMEKCYLLDFIGPDGFAAELSRRSTSQIICFDHRKSVLSRIQSPEDFPTNLEFHVDVGKSSSSATYEYFAKKLSDKSPSDGECVSLLSLEDRERVEPVLRYIENCDFRRWSLPDIKAFDLGIKGWRSRLNCIINPYLFDQVWHSVLDFLPPVAVTVRLHFVREPLRCCFTSLHPFKILYLIELLT
uniref:Uncharacterized protein n=1 Tax=Kalanchoe fedtschenkoi TaxID=63787 RepID=A0A7N0TXD4_KALFE